MDSISPSGGKRCRACLQNSTFQMYSLISKIKTKETDQSLGEIYNQCTELQCEPSDTCWDSVCQICSDKLIEFFQFRKMCIESYKTIEDSIHSNIKLEVVDLNVSVANCVESDDDKATSEVDYFEHQSDKSNDEMPNIGDISFKVETIEVEIGSGYENDDELDARMAESTNSGIQSSSEEGEKDEWSSQGIEKEDSPKPPKRPTAAKHKKPPRKDGAKPFTFDFACNLCPKKFIKKPRYDAHMRKHKGLKQWQCEHCEKAFGKSHTLKAHMEAKHNDEEKGQPEYTCGFEGCGKVYSMRDSLRTHMHLVHLGKKKFVSEQICEECGKTFKSKAALVKHSYIHTKVTPFKCDVCSKMFVSNYKLKEHKLRHDNIRNFVCPICGLRKTTGHELRTHMKFHETDVQYPCELCDMVFTRIANMKRHLKVVHCGLKKFPCTHCDRSFGKAETLKHHIMTHTGERPQVCSICNKGFIQAIALKTHMKTHNRTK